MGALFGGFLIMALAAGCRWPWRVWFPLGLAWFGGWCLSAQGSFWLFFGWLVFGGLLGIPLLRRPLLSAPLFSIFQKRLPPLSETEKTALAAGTVGFEGELFSGRPNWSSLLSLPPVELTQEEQAFLDGPVHQLCGMIDDWDITHVRADLPPHLWEFLARHGFFGMIIPKSYGGLGFSALAHHRVVQKVASVSSVVSSTIAVPNSLGPAELLMHYGTDEQKSYYLPRLARGQDIPCFALTGPLAGSDATSIPDVGVVCHGHWNGQRVLGVRLTFEKRYITLAPVATLIGLAFQMRDPDGLLGGHPEVGISLALLTRDVPGLEIGRRHFPLNIPFQNGPLRGQDVFLPLSHLIGGPAMAGQGWRMLMECLSIGRAITLPSTSSGNARLAAIAVGSYARLRKQFGLPIGRFEGVQEPLSRLASNAYVVSALATATAAAVTRGENPAVPSTIAKYHCTERARQSSLDGMDILGGKGVILGPRNFAGRAWQGAPIAITVEGANIMTRSLMIFGQGAMLCHPWVMKEVSALSSPDRSAALAQFDGVIWKHAADLVGNAVRAFWYGATFSRIGAHTGSSSRWFNRLNRYSAALALVSDASLMLLGGRLKFKESLSGRLGDVLSHLYAASHVLARHLDRGAPAEEEPLLSYAMLDFNYRMEVALSSALRNFPYRPVGWLLWVLVFPWGRRATPPGDGLSRRVASMLLSPGPARDRIAEGIYLDPGPLHPAGRIASYLSHVVAAEPIERKVLKAVKDGGMVMSDPEQQLQFALSANVIDHAEAEQLRRLREMVADAIAVDDFDHSQLTHLKVS